MSLNKKREKYSLAEKEALALLAEKYKILYEKEKEENEKKSKVWDRRRKMFVTRSIRPKCLKEGYLARAVRETFPCLKIRSN